MAHWGWLVCESLSVISFVAKGAWDSSRFDVVLQQDMGVGIQWDAQLEALVKMFVIM
jgi:hypothetical protein